VGKEGVKGKGGYMKVIILIKLDWVEKKVVVRYITRGAIGVKNGIRCP
jgi:hypothetical protein